MQTQSEAVSSLLVQRLALDGTYYLLLTPAAIVRSPEPPASKRNDCRLGTREGSMTSVSQHAGVNRDVLYCAVTSRCTGGTFGPFHGASREESALAAKCILPGAALRGTTATVGWLED
jgi:hypothetical protein